MHCFFFFLNLACIISFEISAERLTIDSFKGSFFSLDTFKFFSLSLFHLPYYDVPLCSFLVFILCVVQSTSWIYGLISSISFRKFSAMISLNIAPVLFFSSSPMTLTIHMLGYFTVLCIVYAFFEIFSACLLYALVWIFFFRPFFQFANSLFSPI